MCARNKRTGTGQQQTRMHSHEHEVKAWPISPRQHLGCHLLVFCFLHGVGGGGVGCDEPIRYSEPPEGEEGVSVSS